MPWLIGIDEAGYGPNLGPFVMTSVACRLPEGAASADLWELLRPAVRRPHEPADDRLLVEDSKVVYSPKDGLARLETGVLATVLCPAADGPFPLSNCVERLAPAAATELAGEPWYAGTTPLPLTAALPDVLRTARRFGEACNGAGTCWGLVR